MGEFKKRSFCIYVPFIVVKLGRYIGRVVVGRGVVVGPDVVVCLKLVVGPDVVVCLKLVVGPDVIVCKVPTISQNPLVVPRPPCPTLSFIIYTSELPLLYTAFPRLYIVLLLYRVAFEICAQALFGFKPKM
jgi:hypothetical protein